MSKVIISGTIESISTRADKTLKVVVGTQELDNQEAGNILSLRGQYTKILFSTDEITEQETALVSKVEIEKPKDKFSASQRLRFTLLNYFKAMDCKDDHIESMYQKEIQKLITNYENLTYELKEK